VGERSDLVVLRSGAVRPIDTPKAQRVDLFESVMDGEPKILYATSRNPLKSTDDDGDVLLQEVDGEIPAERIAIAFRHEYGVHHASFADGVVVISAGCDLSECISFNTDQGEDLKRSSPTDDLPYNDPPYMRDAVLSDDGKLLAYLEGPDAHGASPEEIVGSWSLVVLEQPSGKEKLRVEVAGKDRYTNWFDFDGRWAVLSFAGDEPAGGAWSGSPAGAKPGHVAVVDTAAERPEAVEIGVDGVATFAHR
jgi:hypothetical protein